MKVFLPDGSDLSIADGATGADVAASVSPRLARAAVAAKVGDRVVDLSVTLADGDRVSIITASSPEGHPSLGGSCTGRCRYTSVSRDESGHWSGYQGRLLL
jgi:threonyl-tRNA synthetase